MHDEGDLAIDPELGSRVRQLAAEYSSIWSSIDAALAFLPDAAADLAEFPAEKERVDELDDACRELIDMLHRTDVHADALKRIQRSVEGGGCTDPAGDYSRAVDEALASYAGQTTRRRYARNESYIEFRSRIWDVQGEGAMPPLTDMIPAEPGDNDDDDDELEIGGARIDYKCPITATLLVDPVVNNTCGHAYSREAVHEYIRTARQEQRSAKCPAAGCTATVSERSLQEAPTLRRRVERHERQLLRREEQRRGAALASAAVLD